jgi:hypothetical protein
VTIAATILLESSDNVRSLIAKTSESQQDYVASSPAIVESLSVKVTGTAAPAEGKPASPESIYPHIFDEESVPGQARILIASALSDARRALDSFGAADLEAVGSSLAEVAATLREAHSFTAFNESLGGVVSYVRRAALTARAVEVSRASLNVLVHVLQTAYSNPMLDLDEAADLVEKLEKEGWHGELEVVSALVAALLDDDEEGAEGQSLLFDQLQFD